MRILPETTLRFILTVVGVVVVVAETTAADDELFNCTLAKTAGCECVAKGSEIVCDGKGFNSVPKNLSVDPSTVRALTIRHDRFDGGMLDGPIVYVGLTVLHLDSDAIERVSPGVFVNLTSLQTLTLANNSIRLLQAGIFDGLRSLTLLDLADNPLLYYLGAGTLTGDVLPALSTLKLMRCRINDIIDGALTNLTQLRFVNISGNRLDHLVPLGPGLANLSVVDFSSNRLGGDLDGSPTLCRVPSIEHLLLANNKIERVHANSFCPIDCDNCGARLIELELRNNQLSDVETGTWLPLTVIQRLDLSFNKLTRLNATDMPWDSLKRVLIHNNPWDCSGCDNSWLIEDSVKEWNTGTNVQCSSPEELAGSDVYADELFEVDVFADCDSLIPGGGRTALLVISAVLVAFIVAVAVFCMCRRRRHQRRRRSRYAERALI